MKKFIFTALLFIFSIVGLSASNSERYLKASICYGRIKIVDSKPDFRVKILPASEAANADISIFVLRSQNPNNIGLWCFVERGENYKVQFVERGEDFSVYFKNGNPMKYNPTK